MKLGQLVLFHDSRGNDPQVAIVTNVHSDDKVNLRVIPDSGAAMSFHPNVPRRIGEDHLYSFEAGPAPKAPVAKPAAKKKGR